MTDIKTQIAMVFDKWCFLEIPILHKEYSYKKRKRIALAKADKVLEIVQNIGRFNIAENNQVSEGQSDE